MFSGKSDLAVFLRFFQAAQDAHGCNFMAVSGIYTTRAAKH